MARCSKYWSCYKVSMVLDKDIPAEIINETLRKLCEKCTEKEIDTPQ